MTRAEILDCLTDRPCDYCKFHESGRCERWDCVFEEKPDDCEDTDNYENEIADLQNRLDISEYDKERWKEKVTVLDEKLKALSAEPCEDCVSLRDVIHTIDWWVFYREPDCRQLVIWLKERINELPSVTPKQKVGHWEWVQYDYNPKLGNWHCSECRCIVAECVEAEKRGGIPLYKYCPQCGAKMEEVESDGSAL